MPDLSNERPDRWWVLNALAHDTIVCGVCGAPLPVDHSIPMHGDSPVCAVCAGRLLADTPVTVEYARWIEEGDPRWWSAWMCNCSFCAAEEILD